MSGPDLSALRIDERARYVELIQAWPDCPDEHGLGLLAADGEASDENVVARPDAGPRGHIDQAGRRGGQGQ